MQSASTVWMQHPCGSLAEPSRQWARSRAAVLIASIPRLPETAAVRMLDPGAGSGMLSAALVARVITERADLSVHVVAVERDHLVMPYLRKTLEACSLAGNGRMTFEIVEDDFIMASTGLGPGPCLTGHDLVLQNPPYAKLGASSAHRGSPESVETSVLMISPAGAGLLAPACRVGQACGLPAFPAPRGRSGLRGQGRPEGPSPEGRCGAPLRPEGRPRTLSGRKKASGGAAASFPRPAQRALRGHAASFPGSDRS